MEFFYGAPWRIKKKEDDNFIYECMYDDDPNSTCGEEIVECEHLVHISILTVECI